MGHAQQTWDIRHVTPSAPGVNRSHRAFAAAGVPLRNSDGLLTARQAGGLIGLNANAIIDWLPRRGGAGLATACLGTKITSLHPLIPDERDVR